MEKTMSFIVKQIKIIPFNETKHDTEKEVNLKISELVTEGAESFEIHTNEKFVTIIYEKYVKFEKETTFKIH